jgi:hypothetical protein
MGRWGQKPAQPKGDQVATYTLSADDLAELHQKYGKPGEIAPGKKAERTRDNRKHQAAQNEEVPPPPPEIMGEIEETFGGALVNQAQPVPAEDAEASKEPTTNEETDDDDMDEEDDTDHE